MTQEAQLRFLAHSLPQQASVTVRRRGMRVVLPVLAVKIALHRGTAVRRTVILAFGALFWPARASITVGSV
jgi:hypothetical protein